ncbi:uncharacterized protein STEHIDRAFT_116789 [Stereum hirsutum FP-91666 SS1]|uniref:Uncharacterized protein n=1 Tax=Stereum hirsutum (strain FP-91666) TaxID=721885 RepID=R7RVK2_STEHR|nr:uncharacterized protein STEHIDRAFT_116789 [Stereum hirsutum FP-91666 SS1]EIM79106.1 hypothetical protein STEHIDRAFT_116789 [Stereum hirsutum FP-91666 SS1]
MAFIQDPITLGLVRDDYPAKIARNASEPTDWEQMSKETCVPLGFDDLFDWVKLQELPFSPDPSRKWEVVHVPHSDTFDENSLSPSPQTSLRRMTIRIYGVIGNLNLMDFGNWDRTEAGAAKAMQFLSLRAGPFQLQFSAQQAALADLRKMVFRLLGEHEPNTNYNPDEMFFHRRAFNKIDGFGFQQPLTSALDSDEARLAAMASRWTPTVSPPYGRKLGDGSIKKTNPAVFNRGDFVDVTAAIEIASIGRAAKDRKTNVHFTFTRVVRLLTAYDLNEILGNSIPLSALIPDIQDERMDFEAGSDEDCAT